MDPKLAESLVASHDPLKAATERYPDGRDSILKEAGLAPIPLPDGTFKGGFGSGGRHPEDFPFGQVPGCGTDFIDPRDGHGRRQNFDALMSHALELYQKDTTPDNPYSAPKEFWPSTAAFRTIFFRAGKETGEEAAGLFEFVPDADLKLFSRIEFDTALAGLPELARTTRIFRPLNSPH